MEMAAGQGHPGGCWTTARGQASLSEQREGCIQGGASFKSSSGLSMETWV